ncbi:MAG: hypothetical protein A2842_01825 [Candidatus Wildermuthbacteria bacterium RIFCSPHIGHO2_01_FULL_48_25]|uniref:HIT domain-containing protein n=1 Tax=Candidatus Wildermuthbacteria bacterium RIFCSPLOWO2_01_FULL_48_16 TaxID=1802461 RepID=A0A1G2RKN7_9BACT|nr:MAG: hypothetical protein A2842_01825 [Candidatus Wildermuthbacteria bacterium RIFCSPHIGHO2_01_FULL_48_25]OHA68551.1 MAG: hypothetical protein A3J57_00160 [Candidatus Wildermuthbacteria bacterium RIFCSPHIGHO2_02_FULL_49_12b]OHA73415.1 MAG: hypothetical protein A3B24_02290 [Candidatus Wildermuthbacteria bacterium RIFCSPLOWO2_01_FULL_48_16]
MRKSVVSVKNARKGEYKKVIKEIHQKGKCPFCPENFLYHKNPILKKGKLWFLTKDSWPYKHTKHHFLIIGTKHKEKFSQLKQEDFKEVAELANFAIAKYKIQGGAVAVRFGDTNFTGASVAHLHFHIITPLLKTKNRTQTVQFPIGG